METKKPAMTVSVTSGDTKVTFHIHTGFSVYRRSLGGWHRCAWLENIGDLRDYSDELADVIFFKSSQLLNEHAKYNHEQAVARP